MLNLKKIIMSAAAIICLAALCSCGGAKPDYSKDIDLDEIAQKALAVPEANYKEMVRLSEKKVVNFYPDIDVSQLEDMSINLEGAGAADEFSAFKVKDSSYIETLKTAMQAHSEETIAKNANYRPEEADAIKNALITVKGKYVFYIISANNAKVEETVDALFR
ncbi:MAG: DUF4358 domain-containing protein [Oscillospiraceae bacterium]|jgi:hypothetical protein|nr:DUF4358 domain-containing protein [Oscillospiraceae bacterium]